MKATCISILHVHVLLYIKIEGKYNFIMCDMCVGKGEGGGKEGEGEGEGGREEREKYCGYSNVICLEKVQQNCRVLADKGLSITNL